MKSPTQPKTPWLQSKVLLWLVTLFTLLILAGVIAFMSRQLRRQVREQIVGRDGDILHAVALMHQFPTGPTNTLAPLDEPLGQLNLILETSQLKGVLAARLFSSEGRFVAAFPPGVPTATLSQTDLDSLKHLRPVSQFHSDERLSQLFNEKSSADEATVPLLEVLIPIHEKDATQLLGVAQFILDGKTIAAEFATLDKNLFQHSLVAFLGSGLILVLTSVLAFRRIQKSSRLLADRTESLLRANYELTMTAKTSALGAVSAH